MTRQYAHRPDEEFVRRLRLEVERSLSLAEGTIAKGTHVGIHNAAVDDCWEWAAYDWYLGEPAEQVLVPLRRGAAVVDRTLERFEPPYEPGPMAGWLATAAVAGDAEATQQCARRALAPDAVQVPGRPGSGTSVQALAALLIGETGAAGEHLAALLPTENTGSLGEQSKAYHAMRCCGPSRPGTSPAWTRARGGATRRARGWPAGRWRTGATPTTCSTAASWP